MARFSRTFLEAALVGYTAEVQRINQAIAEIKRELGGRSPTISVNGAAPTGKRRLSPAARRSIAEAQRKRWKAFHKQKAEAAKPKRKMSAARRAVLAANLAKARAAKAARAGTEN